jgi:periplasmic divalent cation tolerance protein
MAAFLQVFTTLADRRDAVRLATEVVRLRLAACGQVLGPMTSSYWWRGRQQRSREWLCLLKTSRRRYPQLEATIRRLHPYETPEIVTVAVVAGSDDYLRWLADSLHPRRGRSSPGWKPANAGRRLPR